MPKSMDEFMAENVEDLRQACVAFQCEAEYDGTIEEEVEYEFNKLLKHVDHVEKWISELKYAVEQSTRGWRDLGVFKGDTITKP